MRLNAYFPTDVWTDDEEAAFAEIMAAGGIERLPAIRLWKRFHRDLKKALRHARDGAPPAMPLARRVQLGAKMRSVHAARRLRSHSKAEIVPAGNLADAECALESVGE